MKNEFADRLSFQTYNEAIAAYEKKAVKKLEVTRIHREVLTEKAATGDTFFCILLRHGCE